VEMGATVVPMRHWELSGHGARKAMSNWFNSEEVHSEANHLGDYVGNHPFIGEHPQKSMNVAIKRDTRKFRVFGFSNPRHKRPSKFHNEEGKKV